MLHVLPLERRGGNRRPSAANVQAAITPVQFAPQQKCRKAVHDVRIGQEEESAVIVRHCAAGRQASNPMQMSSEASTWKVNSTPVNIISCACTRSHTARANGCQTVPARR